MSEPKTMAKRLEPFVCGGSAATFASVIIHPIDLAKGESKQDGWFLAGTQLLLPAQAVYAFTPKLTPTRY